MIACADLGIDSGFAYSTHASPEVANQTLSIQTFFKK